MKLRVLIINLNNQDYTKNCINLLLNQKFNDFKITLFDQNSNEIGTEEMLNYFKDKGVDVIKNKTNDPVNSVWNWFYNNHTEDILCFLNNDVLIYDNFISDVMHVFENEPNVGIAVHSTNHDDYTTKKEITEYKVVEPKNFMQGWDFSIRRNVFTLIPEQLKRITDNRSIIDGKGNTIKEVIDNLIKQFNNLKPRLIKENGELNSFINIYINQLYEFANNT